jgi:hypothetical protein
LRRRGDRTGIHVSSQGAGGDGKLAGKEGPKEGVRVGKAVLKAVGAEEPVVFEEGAVTWGREGRGGGGGGREGGRVTVGVVIVC